MKIGIDARMIIDTYSPTWPNYLSGLLSGLQHLDKSNSYFLYVNYFRRRYDKVLQSFPLQDNFQFRTLRVPHKIANFIFETLHFPMETVVGKVDIFHGPIYTRLNTFYGKSIVTVHDLIFIRYPDMVPPAWLDYVGKNIEYSLRRADAIIAISEFTKKDIVDFFKIPEERIRVIHNGVDRYFTPNPENGMRVKEKFGIGGEYLLSVGANEPRKNLQTLLRAFHALPPTVKENHHLVIVGVERYRSEQVYAMINELQLERYVIFTNKVSREELSCLYSGAAIFIFPSLIEGFGMPLLEAMACGAPVIASNCTAIPEVVGEAGILIEPLNPDEISQAIENVLGDMSLREGLRQKGFKRVSRFSWEKAAGQTLSLYNEVA